jgi:diguanylate cyclase (GGDEF)-like protein
MKYEELLHFLQHMGKDPSWLIFEDELTGIYNRRFLLNYFEHKIPWENVEDHPFSLLLMDIDYFKKINDTYGHEAGDNVLIRIGNLLKEMAGEEGLPIRYAGDEFMILLPHGEKKEALTLGQMLLERVREESLESEKGGNRLKITLSIGIASAPEDARTGKGLIKKADTALYYAKKVGRNRLAHAGEVNAQVVFVKTALHQLEGEKITGRGLQLAQVAKYFQNFRQGQSQFLIIEGNPGMGKTSLLETIHRVLSPSKLIKQVRVRGRIQEMFSPYALMTHILVALLNHRQDKGVGIFEALSSKEMSHLARILPHLAGPEEVPRGENLTAQRQGLFNTLLYFVPKTLDFQPLLLLIDDLQFADEATLLLLRRLMLQREGRFFLCGTSTPIDHLKREEQASPFARFYGAYQPELDIHSISLTPLTVQDIADHLKGVFPQMKIPENLDKDLARITQGNPLFVNEILRKLILDQKVLFSGSPWRIEPLEKDYFPASLEEMITRKMAALDEESRQLLCQAAIFGEETPLSLLAGSSRKREAQLLEQIDQVADQGLIRSDFHLNDETIRFLGKPILQTIYGAIPSDQKKALHDQIGHYQETLFQKRLLPSTVTLVYHFKSSANLEKVREYEQTQEFYDHGLFNIIEAAQYTGERRKRVEQAPPGAPLDPEGLGQVPTVIRCLMMAVRNNKIYPTGSEPVVSGNRQLKEAIDSILATNENLTFFQIDHVLMVNGQKIDVSEFKWIAEDFLKFLRQAELKGILFYRGLADQEIEALMEAFGRVKPQMISKDFWKAFSAEQRLTHLELKQVRYTLMVDSAGPPKERRSLEGVTVIAPVMVSPQQLSKAQELDQEDLARIPEILRCLLSAVKNIKLYPLESKAVLTSVDQLQEALRPFLRRRSVLTAAQVGHGLLINGVKIDASKVSTLVEASLRLLDELTLQSLTFLDPLSNRELKAFLGVLVQPPPTGWSHSFWIQFAKEEKFSSILFDQILYEPRVTPSRIEPQEQEWEEPDGEAWEVVMTDTRMEDLLDPFFKEMPSRMSDYLIREDGKKTALLIRQLFHGFHYRAFPVREKVIEGCRRMLEDLTLAFQHRLARLLTDPLLVALWEEKDPTILREIAFVLHQMATQLIHFAEYPLASRILFNLHDHHRKLLEAKDPHAQRLGKILDRKLEIGTQKLLVNDLKSNEPSRQQKAAQLLGSLGPVTLPLLLEIIKTEEDLRVRQIAARLLSESGPEAADLLKRDLILEGKTEERIRILEVIDTVTRDLKNELAFVLADELPEVRRAALHLAERLGTNQVVELLLDLAKTPVTHLAVEAIECLGKLKPPAANNVLLSLLTKARDSKRLAACCRALGQIADPGSAEPLIKILMKKTLFLQRKKHRSRVRLAAAVALSQMDHPQVVKVMAQLLKDHDARVKEVARNWMSLTREKSSSDR